MFITIINDCRDDNARVRQQTKLQSLFRVSANFLGVKSELEAAGNLIDILAAGRGEPGVILVNVAPRNGQAKKWKNGTPFAYFYYRKTLVVSSIAGETLSLVKKLKLADYLTFIEPPKELEKIFTESQFRSFSFLPEVAAELIAGQKLGEEKLPISEVPETPAAIWWLDNFGNAKTTLTYDDLKLKNDRAETVWGPLPFYQRLSQVPDGQIAIIIGSSGLPNRQFIEIVKQGGSATENLKLQTGQTFLPPPQSSR